MIGIYKITIGPKFYYGQSVNLTKRKSQHLCNLKNNKHSNIYMQNCFNKYLNFNFEIIELIGDTSLLNDREQYYIDLHFEDPDCMNLARQVTVYTNTNTIRDKLSEVGRGRFHTEETKAKMSKTAMGKPPTTKGTSLSEETKKKISLANKGKKHTAETIAKMIETKKANRLLKEEANG